MDSLEQKYLNLLSSYENLHKELESLKEKKEVIVEKKATPSNCEKNLNSCSTSYQRLLENRNLLKNNLVDLYARWIPPKVSSFFQTMRSWAKSGFKKSKFSEMRLDICKSCEFITERDMCKICGCYMKGKVTIPQASCPIGKWVKEIPKDK